MANNVLELHGHVSDMSFSPSAPASQSQISSDFANASLEVP